jgi:hypothetical protein
MDQYPARQDPERTLDNAHILVQHEMVDICAVKQRTDCRNQYDIVGPDQFPHFRSPCRTAPAAELHPCRSTPSPR